MPEMRRSEPEGEPDTDSSNLPYPDVLVPTVHVLAARGIRYETNRSRKPSTTETRKQIIVKNTL